MVAPKNDSSFVYVPGYAEAQRREQDLRDRAFLPLNEEIAGVPVRPFCPAHLLALDALRNGFVTPCIFDRESERVAHALQFLWVVSTEYRLPRGPVDSLYMRWVRKRFVKRLYSLSSEAVFFGIKAYIKDSFYDLSGGGGSKSPQYFSYMASLVDALCGAGYAWTEEQILNTPFKRIAQYLRASQKRINPESVMSNPSDRVAIEALAEYDRKKATNG